MSKLSNLNRNNCQIKLFLWKNYDRKAIKMLVLCFRVEKFNVLLECLLPHTHSIVYTKRVGGGIQTTVKPNEPSSFMTVYRYGSNNRVMAVCHNLVNLISTEIFVAWVVFMKAIFSCLNLKFDEGLLPHSMPEVFNKTGHGLTDIIIA